MHTLITLTGPSGSGKSTIERILTDKYAFRKAISFTTRSRRESELEGVDYYFVDKQKIEKMYANNELAEYIEYNNNYYGVSIDELKNSNVIVVEPYGLTQIRKIGQDLDINIISIYLDIDPSLQFKRMKCRGDNDVDIHARIEKDREWFKPDTSLYDYIFKSEDSPDNGYKIAEFINLLTSLDVKFRRG